MTEKELEIQFTRSLKKNNLRIYVQIPFISRIIDIVEITKSGSIISYELKIKNWKKAIEQIRNHSIASHYSYLCMPKRRVGAKKLYIVSEICEKEGFGFILWDEKKKEVEKIIKAKKNIFRNKYASRKLKENIKGQLKNE
jgi:hypothetical protein